MTNPFVSAKVVFRSLSCRFAAFGGLVVEDAALCLSEPLGELFGVVALLQAGFLGNLAFAPQVENIVVQQTHAVPRAGLNRRRDAENLVLADQVGNAWRDHKGFE